jgi:hypothetical protein
MRRESHVRFCEGGGVRFPSATRPVWERRRGTGRNVTVPSPQSSINSKRRSLALLRPATAMTGNNALRDLIRQAYGEYETQAGS